MAKDKNKNEVATYIPPQQQTQYMAQTQYMPQQGYAQQQPYVQQQPYMPTTQPLIPTVNPANPSSAVLTDESVIIAPKKPPKSLRPITLKSLFWGIILLFVFVFVAFMIGTYFFVDTWNPFKIIGDFFGNFDFGKFFREFFGG